MTGSGIPVFETSAQEYDAWFDRHRPVYESELLALRRFISPGGLGLETGVGTGRFAAPLGLQIGVEPAPAMAVLAQKRGIKVFRAVAESLPFRAASFDLVAMITVICFLRDPFLGLTEATRVLKSGGQILIGMIDRDSPLGRSYQARKQESKFYCQARFSAVGQVLAWLTELGFQQPEVCQTLFQPRGEITRPEPVRAGYGDGGFVVITARR
jgi:SAM-dependent methyltransferase